MIFPVLPYKENRVFKINFYDPGFGNAKDAYYTVTGSELLKKFFGRNTDCWIMEHNFTFAGKDGTQIFWVSEQTNKVIKEVSEYKGAYGYKLLTEVLE